MKKVVRTSKRIRHFGSTIVSMAKHEEFGQEVFQVKVIYNEYQKRRCGA
jgi:hypothetical protein